MTESATLKQADSQEDMSLQELGEGTQSVNARMLFLTLIGGAFVLNSYLSAWTYEAHLARPDRLVTGLCALFGAVLLSGPVVLRSVKAVLKGEHDIGEMASLAILACFAIGEYQEAGIVAFLFMLAELLEERTAIGAKAAIERLIRLTPTEAHKVNGDDEVSAPVASLQSGDIIRVRPGENIPVDGTLVKGESSINQASVTGESLPVDCRQGSTVFAGTINLTGVIEIEVSKVGAETTLGQVQDMILEAENTRLPVLRIIDRYIQWYTPVMIMIAIIIFYFSKNIENAISALIVGCPIALVLATPTAMVAGLTCAARFGILIKNIAHLESAAKIDAFVFDKTGTLTTGQLTVNRLAPIADVSPADFVRFAASADRYSNHPAARALARVASDAKVPLATPEQFTEVGGKGVIATVDGARIRVGRHSWLESEGVSFEGVEEPKGEESDGFSFLYVAKDDRCIGWASMLDRPCPEAQAATEELKKLGIDRLTMLTGDRWGIARRVATQLGCTDVVAECLPLDKLELVKEMKAKGHKVAVIGDGVNDAPALAAGDLGIAMGAAGNDIAIHSASIALMSDDISRLPLLIRLSRQVRSVVVQNLIFGLLLMMSGLVFSGLGYLSPIGAALFQNIGSLVVMFSSARLARFGEDRSQ